MLRSTNKDIAMFSVEAYLNINDSTFVLLAHFLTLSNESTIVRLRKLTTGDRFAICKFDDEIVLVYIRVSPFWSVHKYYNKA